MNAPPRSVALVVDRDFGDRVRPVSERMHVWLIDSAANRAVAESIWETLRANTLDNPSAQRVTLFQSPRQLSPDAVVQDILGTILEHHFGVGVLEIYGVRDLQRLEAILGGSGFVISSEKPAASWEMTSRTNVCVAARCKAKRPLAEHRSMWTEREEVVGSGKSEPPRSGKSGPLKGARDGSK